MKKTNFNLLLSFVVLLIATGCEKEQVEPTEVINESVIVTKTKATPTDKMGSSPWNSSTFGPFFVGSNVQVDDDGNDAHNWNSTQYQINMTHGIDVTSYIWENNNELFFECPSGNGPRRAEFRDEKSRRLYRWNLLEFTCKIENVPSDKKVIIAQLHNDDNSVDRPYITVFIDGGQIFSEQTSNPTGNSNNNVKSDGITFYNGDRYSIRISSANKTVKVTATIKNLDRTSDNEDIESYRRPSTAWKVYDGTFYYKFGAYMPNGGSNNTTNRISALSMSL